MMEIKSIIVRNISLIKSHRAPFGARCAFIKDIFLTIIDFVSMILYNSVKSMQNNYIWRLRNDS